MKKAWLKKTFSKSPNYYLDITKDFSNMLKIKQDCSPPFSPNTREFTALIFNEHAKPRTMALLIFQMSLIGLLSIKNSEGIKQVFVFYQGTKFNTIVISIFAFVAIILTFFMALKFILYFGALAFGALSVEVESKRSRNIVVARELIRDLIEYHITPKARVKRRMLTSSFTGLSKTVTRFAKANRTPFSLGR